MVRPASLKLALPVALVLLLAPILAFAQTSALKYDKGSEVKLKGVIEEVTTAADNNVHITLKCEKGALDVFVAPEKFLKDMEITFTKGDSVEIVGSQLTAAGSPLVLARKLTRNGDEMVMRDDSGKPVWVGWTH